MQYFKTPDGKIRAIDEGQEHLVGEDWGRMTDDEVKAEINPPLSIDDLATAKRREIEVARSDAFAAGMPTTVNGNPETVQARPQDQVNLLGLRMKAESAKASGDTTASQKFRGKSNATHLITPDEMIDLTNAALDYIEGIYEQSWQLKDQVDTAEEAGDREAIEAIKW